MLSLVLEGHDHKTHEDVNHEEGDDDDVDEEEDSDSGPVVVDWTDSLFMGVDSLVHKTKNGKCQDLEQEVDLSTTIYFVTLASLKNINTLRPVKAGRLSYYAMMY